jgi:hypothetical protein
MASKLFGPLQVFSAQETCPVGDQRKKVRYPSEILFLILSQKHYTSLN